MNFGLIRNIARNLICGAKSDSQAYIKYLRSLSMEIGEETTSYVPNKTQIDITRPWLIGIGKNVKLQRAQRFYHMGLNGLSLKSFMEMFWARQAVSLLVALFLSE